MRAFHVFRRRESTISRIFVQMLSSDFEKLKWSWWLVAVFLEIFWSQGYFLGILMSAIKIRCSSSIAVLTLKNKSWLSVNRERINRDSSNSSDNPISRGKFSQLKSSPQLRVELKTFNQSKLRTCNHLRKRRIVFFSGCNNYERYEHMFQRVRNQYCCRDNVAFLSDKGKDFLSSLLPPGDIVT